MILIIMNAGNAASFIIYRGALVYFYASNHFIRQGHSFMIPYGSGKSNV